jgi:hypothetical protein
MPSIHRIQIPTTMLVILSRQRREYIVKCFTIYTIVPDDRPTIALLAMPNRSHHSTRSKKGNVRWIVQTIMLCATSFYAGISVGVQIDRTPTLECWTEKDPRLIEYVRKKVNLKLRKYQKQSLESSAMGEEATRIPKETMGKVVTGMGRVDRDRFATKFEMVIPTKSIRNVTLFLL